MSGSRDFNYDEFLCDYPMPDDSGVGNGEGFLTGEAIVLGIADLLDGADTE